MVVENLDGMDIGAPGEERMDFQFRAKAINQFVRGFLHKEDDMGVSHGDAC